MTDRVSQHLHCNAYCHEDVHVAIAFYGGRDLPNVAMAQLSADLNATRGLLAPIQVLSVEPALEHPPGDEGISVGWPAMLVHFKFREVT